MPSAGVVIIGDEILTGKFRDENAPFLVDELYALGVDLRRIEVIPDHVETIAETVPWCASRFDAVFTSGGVGPTHDDVTIEGIARGFGVETVMHPELERRVRGYWGDRLCEANLRLARVPEGATLVFGNDATWPAVVFRNVHILPGVPALFRRKFLELRDRFRTTPTAIARLYLAADEGEIADALREAAAAHAVKIGSYPRFEEVEFRVLITIESKEPAQVEQAFQFLRARFGALVVKARSPELVGGAG